MSESSTDISASSLKMLYDRGIGNQTVSCEASKQDNGHIIAEHSLPAVQLSSSSDLTFKSSPWQTDPYAATRLDPFQMRHVCLKELELLWSEEVLDLARHRMPV